MQHLPVNGKMLGKVMNFILGVINPTAPWHLLSQSLRKKPHFKHENPLFFLAQKHVKVQILLWVSNLHICTSACAYYPLDTGGPRGFSAVFELVALSQLCSWCRSTAQSAWQQDTLSGAPQGWWKSRTMASPALHLTQPGWCQDGAMATTAKAMARGCCHGHWH